MKDKGSDGRPPQIHIDQAVIEHYGLNHNAGWLYVVIVSHVNGKTGVAFPGLARLAKLTGMSKPTVIKYMKVLEDKKLIEVIRENVEGTSEKDVNHYKVLPVIGGKTVLPPSKEDTEETDVVKPFDYVKKPVDHPSKTVLPQVVKPVDNNHIESNHLELTKRESAAPARENPQTAEIKLLVKRGKKPSDTDVLIYLEKFGLDMLTGELRETATKSTVQNDWNYTISAIEGKLHDAAKKQPPSSSGAVSPNGKKPLSENNPMRRYEKASGE